VRIISGKWRGRPLVAPVGQQTRPTADRVRETLFSMLASRLGTFDGLAVADLYAGSGALGIEALSRGAASCRFVDSDRAAVDAIRRNLEKLDALDLAEIQSASAERLAPGQAFDLVFADPPYVEGAGTKVARTVARADWIAPGGWLAIETGRKDAIDPGIFTMVAERDVARARLTLLRRD
jgi:16S rRNA (guanine966-N2)-methyltransferase